VDDVADQRPLRPLVASHQVPLVAGHHAGALLGSRCPIPLPDAPRRLLPVRRRRLPRGARPRTLGGRLPLAWRVTPRMADLGVVRRGLGWRGLGYGILDQAG